MTFALSSEEQVFFAENGYVGPFSLPIEPSELARIRDHIYRDVLEKPSEVYPEDQPGTPKPFTTPWYARQRDRHLEDRVVFDLTTHPAIVQRLQPLMGRNLLMWRTTLFQKDPGDPLIAWHQGLNFPGHEGRPSLVPIENLTAWIAIDEANRSNSCVQVIPGSHREGWQDYRPAPPDEQVFSTNLKMNYEVDPARVVDIECKQGQFFLFDEMLIHGSHPNTSNKRRMGIAARYSNPAVKIYKETFPVKLGTRAMRWPKLVYPMKDLTICGEGLSLDKWGCILLSGTDSYGHNRYADPPSAKEIKSP